MLFGAFTLQNFMTTNLTRDLDATPRQERLETTITAKDSLYPVAFKYAEQTGFDLETDDDGSYNLRRWFGPDNSPLSPIVLPRDPATLLQLLELTSHPEAGDIAQFWLNLQKFLPFLSAFMQNVAWPHPNLMKFL